MIGDWNADLLPTLDSDPFHHNPNRTQHHKTQRELSLNFAHAARSALVVPSPSSVSACGSFEYATTLAPITRIPLIRSAATTQPSCLDYGSRQHNAIADARVTWQGSTSDHAMVNFTLKAAHMYWKFQPMRWRCSNMKAAVQWARRHMPTTN